MPINPSELKNGMIFKDKKGNPVQVLDIEHKKLSKGGGAYTIKFKNLITGAIAEDRFDSNKSLDEVFVEKVKLMFTYSQKGSCHFINEDLEEVVLPASELGEIGNFLNSAKNLDKLEVIIRVFKDENNNSNVVGSELLDDITVEVVDTRPSIKGETAKAGMKPAKVDGGIDIKVPTHVNTGDFVILSKVDFSYLRKK